MNIETLRQFTKFPKTYKTILEAYTNNKLLKKVRLKIDPVNKDLSQFAHLNGYEGYILSEDISNETIDVMVIGDMDNPLVKNVPYACVDQPSIIEPINKFKIATKTYLKHKLDIKEDNAIFDDIEKATTRKNIENILSEYGIDKPQINEIYKLYVLTNDVI